MEYLETLEKSSQYELIFNEHIVSNIDKDAQNSVSVRTNFYENQSGNYNVSTTTNTKTNIVKKIFYNNNQEFIKTGDFPVNIGDNIILIFCKGETNAKFRNSFTGYTENGNYIIDKLFKENVLLAVKNKTNGRIWYLKPVRDYFKENFRLIHINLKKPLIFTIIFSVLSLILFTTRHYFIFGLSFIGLLISGIIYLKNFYYFQNKKNQVISVENFEKLVKINDDKINRL